MAETFKVLNFKHVFDPMPTGGLSYQTIYTVPALKIAQINIDRLNADIEMDTSDVGGTFAFDQVLDIGNVEFNMKYGLTNIVSVDQLKGGIFEDQNLTAPADFWQPSGEFLLPKSNAAYIDVLTANDSEEVRRGDLFEPDLMRAPQRVPRTFYLEAGQTLRFGTQLTTSLTVVTSKLVVVCVGSIIEIDA